MAKSKTPTKSLTKIFDATSAPIYIIGPDQILVYANQACANWVQSELSELIGKRCLYTTRLLGDPIENRLKGLCPPANVNLQQTDNDPSTGQPSTTFLAYASDKSEHQTWRSAAAYCLDDIDSAYLGTLVVCDATFTSPPHADQREPESLVAQRLHETLAKIRSHTDRLHSLERLVGVSPVSKRVRRQVQTAIETRSDLLIIGQPGTGKQHLARTIHATRNSSQPSELFPIDASVTATKQIEQHIHDLQKRFSATNTSDTTHHRASLLLLNVDLLGEAAQHRLLEFLDDCEFELPIIATASESPLKSSQDGNFLAELACRLSTMTIELPPLSDRPEDIPVLAQAFLERDNEQRARPLTGFSNGAMLLLCEYHWPENIDQLNRIVQSATENTNGPEIQTADLPDEFHYAIDAMRVGTAKETKIDLEAFLGEIEKELVARALKQAKGNKTKAAGLLGISRAKLLRRLSHFGFSQPNPTDDVLDSSAFEELD